MKIYALYKGDKMLAMGTLLQIAFKTNVKYETIKFYLSPTYIKRCKNSKMRRVLVEVE